MNTLWLRFLVFITVPLAAAGFLYGMCAGRLKAGIITYNSWAARINEELYEELDADDLDFGDDDGSR